MGFSVVCLVKVAAAVLLCCSSRREDVTLTSLRMPEGEFLCC